MSKQIYLIQKSLTLSFFENFALIIPTLSYSNFKNIEFTSIVNYMDLIKVLKTLKNHINFQYNSLSCISGVDFLKTKYRFLVSYELLSIVYNLRLRIKVFINDFSILESSVSIYVNGNWWEREIWDMFGIFFTNHPDLRRILTDYGFEGYPLRKDFPLFGYTELRYDNSQKLIVFENVNLSQEFRVFTYENSW